MPTLYIIRGLPGSGKTTLAKQLVGNTNYIEADIYFMDGDNYKYDPSKIREAHEWCKKTVKVKMYWGLFDIAVSNTFVKRWEYQPYIEMAKEAKYDIQIIECHGQWKSVHNVPEEVISRMRENWESFDGIY